jgi:hypothetical protein
MKYAKTLLLALLLFAGQRSQAVDVGFYGNLDISASVGNTGSTVGGASGAMFAQGFTMGSTKKYSFERFYLGEGNVVNGGTPLVSIYSDNAGAPGTALTSNLWDGTAASLSPNATFMNVATPFELSAGTKYWFVVSEATSGAAGASFAWVDSSPAVLPSDYFTTGSGVTYLGTKTKTTTTAWTTSPNGNLGFRLGGTPTAVPEPSTYVMISAAMGVLGVIARRNKSAKI